MSHLSLSITILIELQDLRTLPDLIKRISVTEDAMNYGAEKQGKPSDMILGGHFGEARQTIYQICGQYAQGKKTFLLQDAEQTEAICIRVSAGVLLPGSPRNQRYNVYSQVLEVKKLNEKTPIVFFIWATADVGSPIDSIGDFLAAGLRSGGVPHFACTVEEQALLRKLLLFNSKRIQKTYKAEKKDYERACKTSFFLPIGPLTQVDIGTLTAADGCFTCGGIGAWRCAQCQSASYCNAGRHLQHLWHACAIEVCYLECQRADWKNHKQVCKSLTKAAWDKIHLASWAHGKDSNVSYYNLHDRVGSAAGQNGVAAPQGLQPNIHGDAPFLVKIQKPLAAKGTPYDHMLVYDRQRTVKCHLYQGETPEVFSKAMDEMPKSQTKLKIYRWAKRTGDYELSICLDRGPDPEPTW